MSAWQAERERMVRSQIEQRGIVAPRILDAFRGVPRHAFVPPALQDEAYEDHPLPIGEGQTISQPYIVALMTGLLDLQGEETVLEIGAGSGYQAAILGRLARRVHSVERIPALAESARRALAALGIENVQIHTADGSLGWPAAAPYQGILVTAAAPAAPAPLLEQLAEGGRMVLPVGARGYQELQLWQRQGAQFTHETVLGVVFVPLRGQFGWSPQDWEEAR